MSSSSVPDDHNQPVELDSIEIAKRGREVTGADIYRTTSNHTDSGRIQELLDQMHTDVPSGGIDIKYGEAQSQKLRFWPGKPGAPIVIYIHGGSWRVGTYLDSMGSKKVDHLTNNGYSFATVNFTLFPKVSVQEQVQEIAKSIKFLVNAAEDLKFDPERLVIMGHSSGAHVAALLGTDASYLSDQGISLNQIEAVVALDGSNYNAPAELLDSPGPIADNMVLGLGKDIHHQLVMSPTFHTRLPNAKTFLLLHVQRHGDIRQAVEFASALKAAGTTADLRVFEGEFFEGHTQLLLRLGDLDYPATLILDRWLQQHVPITGLVEPLIRS